MNASIRSLVISALLSGAIALPSSATLLIDFGATISVNDTLFSPAHQDGGLSASLDTWNTVGAADVAAGGLKYADGTTATGVALNIGVGDGAGNAVNFASTPSGSTLGSSATAWGDSPLRDTIFNSAGSLGFQISGLSAGIYDIFITGRNTNATTAYTATLYAVGSVAAVANIASSATQSDTMSNPATSAATIYVTDLVEGLDYAKIASFTLTAGQSLYLAWDASSSEARPFASSLAIVAIPEPGTLSLIGLALVAALPLLRRQLR